MSKKFVRVPMTVTLQGTVLVELQENESLETIDPMELEVRALENFDCNNNEFYAVAKEKSVRADGRDAAIRLQQTEMTGFTAWLSDVKGV